MASSEKNIVIVGGGIIGSCTAYFLTRHPLYNPKLHKITLLESTKIAGGASGKAGGLLALWAYPEKLVPLSYRTHAELAERHNGAERWGYRAVHCGQIECKVAKPANIKENQGHESLLKRSAEAKNGLRAVGIPDDLDWIDGEALKEYEEMSTPQASAQVHPFKFTTAMAELAAEGGAEIKVGAHVTNITYEGKKVTGVSYKTDGQESHLAATDVIVAAGPWTKSVFPSAPINALRAHSVVIEPTRPVSAYCLFTSIGLGGKTVTPEIYARQDEVYACGEGDRLVPLPPTTAEVQVDESRCQEVLDQVGAVSEVLKHGKVTARQACYLPEVEGGRDPLVGPTGTEGLWLAAGHTCWGIQNGPGSGKIMAEWVFDGEAKSAKSKGMDPRNFL